MTYRVVTRNIGDTYSELFSGTRAECRRYMIGRWGHFPGFAVITTRSENFHLCKW